MLKGEKIYRMIFVFSIVGITFMCLSLINILNNDINAQSSLSLIQYGLGILSGVVFIINICQKKYDLKKYSVGVICSLVGIAIECSYQVDLENVTFVSTYFQGAYLLIVVATIILYLFSISTPKIKLISLSFMIVIASIEVLKLFSNCSVLLLGESSLLYSFGCLALLMVPILINMKLGESKNGN